MGYITSGTKIQELTEKLKNIPKVNAMIPDFEFSKQEIIDAEAKLPFLFNLSFTGKIKNAKELSVKFNGIKRTRLSNIDELGVEIASLLSLYAQNKTRLYRKYIKNDYVAEALFYAESFEIELEKETGVNIGVEFDVNTVEVEAKIDTETQKKYIVKYKNNQLAPFGAIFTKGKDLF